ncbi:hypothetical protein BST14_24430 [Mycobacterium arosiense ATCC BAA-1401 = DSM 45069]|uniref:ESX-1 secretion-associated protein n=1 Tax=Mycobacterium arosiense ATCC BAA-1401 = DSM 45069 TaxID=1265311 RepID=A0A1W9Z7E5_MYCAI|nr:hypothetical protein BST14_24430 [Mycobacterium arosiense ATCC BAA-1401 = DSM 45069]
MRADGASVQAVATRWAALTDGLNDTAAATGLGSSWQPSAAAVNGAQVDVAAFAAGLAARVSARATCVRQADTRYGANEAESATDLAAVGQSVISV